MSLMGYGTAGPGRARRPWRWRCLARSSSSRPFWPRGSFDGSERGIATAPAAGGVGGGGRSHHLGVGAPLEAAVALAVCDDACPADRADPARRRADIYFFLVYGLIPQAFMLLPGRWAYVAAAGVFVVASTAHWGVGVLTDPGRLTQLVGNLALASAVGLFINALARQSEERRRIIVELENARAENTRLLAEARQSAVLQERQRMAGEIHDTLAQGLTGIVTQLEAAEQALDDQSAGVRRHLDTARRLARESLAEARRSVQALRPQPLEAVQLPEAVAQVAARWAHDTGIAATATTTGAPRPLHPEVEVTLLRAAQEAFTNAARHARPSAVSLTLSYMEDLVSLDPTTTAPASTPQFSAATDRRAAMA